LEPFLSALIRYASRQLRLNLRFVGYTEVILPPTVPLAVEVP
jgi:hypothetical protein